MLERIKNYWNLIVDELLNKVTWPTWDELRQASMIVLVASIIIAALVYLADIVLGFILQFIYGIFG
ncbi:MAG: preprotein translocase subunit SecE [Bacteroidia bacterium]|jgi:preprotein translocase subunit SecE|nr:preprotein translocase subunit SecE [Bacteroidia bacterium]MCO5253203.1 preprotein translocase subunit SecE [Bacteroidota bacterium]MCZ2128814.1 preprotein translocase subunit SecE [Bacteroidia bacterium]